MGHRRPRGSFLETHIHSAPFAVLASGVVHAGGLMNGLFLAIVDNQSTSNSTFDIDKKGWVPLPLPAAPLQAQPSRNLLPSFPSFRSS